MDPFHIPDELKSDEAPLGEGDLIKQLGVELARIERSGAAVSIVVVAEVDAKAEETLRASMRPYDQCFRGANDQLMILLPDTDHPGCEQFVRRVDRLLELPVLGWATSSKDKPRSAAELIGDARSVMHFNHSMSGLGQNLLLTVDPWDANESTLEELPDAVDPELRQPQVPGESS